MSALDQAFIKAYTKDQPAAPVAAAHAPPPLRKAPATAGPAARTIEQAYRDGSLYRVDVPKSAAPAPAAVPAPHVRLLPPTSPRRGVRRSVLKLLAGQVGGQAAAARIPSPPQADAASSATRVARKIIIRHVPHAAVPPQRGSAAPPVAQPFDDLPPESIVEPVPSGPPPLDLPPSLPPLTPADAGNRIPSDQPRVSFPDLANVPAIEVHGTWDISATIAPLVVVAEQAELAAATAEALVSVQLDDLPTPTSVVEPQITSRVDPPHARAPQRPHVRFDAPPRPASAARSNAPATDVPPAPPAGALERDLPNEAAGGAAMAKHAASQLPTHQELDPEEIRSLLDEELPPAEIEIVDDALTNQDSGESPAEPATRRASAPAKETANGAPAAAPVGATPSAGSLQPTAPEPPAPVQALWEVDRFYWPKTCERLLSDKGGYFAQAGEKLRAAAADGLRVLGVTGSRRGEGRTTLALCLARAAADAGLDVALIDGDFARPQLAGKLGVEAAFGWQDAAVGKVPLSEAAVKSLLDNVTVLPLEGSSARSRLSLADARVTAILREAAATFDLVILDLGPMASGETLSFPPGEACPLDAAIVVRDLRFASAVESDAIGQALYNAGIDAVGIAENFVVEEQAAALTA